MYPINEVFTSFQGEGVHMGRRAHFIRLQGCDVRCPWCDQAATWNGTEPSASAHQLAKGVPADAIVVVTGGEPTIHNLGPLTEAIHNHRNIWNTSNKLNRLHLETAGHRPITGSWHWIALSPKPGRPPLPENVERADEFKIILANPADLTVGLAALKDRRPGTPIWLHPEASRRDDQDLLSFIASSVGGDLRAGWQLHRLYGAR